MDETSLLPALLEGLSDDESARTIELINSSDHAADPVSAGPPRRKRRSRRTLDGGADLSTADAAAAEGAATQHAGLVDASGT